VLPTGVIENGDSIARPQAQHPTQMPQLPAVDDSVLALDIFSKHKETSHNINSRENRFKTF
jgi:hypothetical protein